MQSQWITILVLLFGLQGTKQTNEQMKPTPPVDIEKIPSLHYKLLSKQAKKFFPVYVQYVKLMQTKGTQGLKEIVSSDFVLGSGKSLVRGQKALNTLDIYGADQREVVSVRVRQLIFKRDKVIASITETRQFRIKSLGRPDMVGSFGGDWKHTWRRTAKGWKLASIGRETRNIKEDGFTLTFTSPVLKQ
ncbi:MAG: hypothetical protein H7308_07180 [Chthonomonadaceae bacterium]|nr:hypothetical protein [Chthonomonadaceae bacterium]